MTGATTTEIICFTDLKGSTAATEEQGHSEYMPLLNEHLEVGRLLAARNDGIYVKNIGDAHLVRFSGVENALTFAAQMQEYCTKQPARIRAPFEIKIALFQGAVVPDEENIDVFGSAVNQGARLQSLARSGQILLNEDMRQMVAKVFGALECERICTFVEEVEFKGVMDPPRHKVYNFDHGSYLIRSPRSTLAALVQSHLENSGIEVSNIQLSDRRPPGTVIWPVVPRDVVTAIHRGQIEVIRLLAAVGWNITVLIADCGGESEYSGKDIKAFVEALEKHGRARDVDLRSVLQMSQLFDPGFAEYKAVQDTFRQIVGKMTVEVLMKLNKKDYSQADQEQIDSKATLTYIRPALTLAAVLHLAFKAESKCIVIAGADERLQWQQAYYVQGGRVALGACLIPVIRTSSEYQVLQGRSYPIWDSVDEASRQCVEDGNVAEWLYRMLARVPAFPHGDPPPLVKEGAVDEPWARFESDARVARELVEFVWPILSPI